MDTNTSDIEIFLNDIIFADTIADGKFSIADTGIDVVRAY